MKRWIKKLAWLSLMLPWSAQAMLTIEITGGSAAALPIAIVPFGSTGIVPPENMARVISDNLRRSGRFAPLSESDLISRPSREADVNFADWRLLRSDSLVIGHVTSQDGHNYEVEVQLFDVYRARRMVGKRYQVQAAGVRALAHQISDLIYETLTGEMGVFSTRLAFVTTVKNPDGSNRFALQVSDSDGANPRTILQSNQPIMSPRWSPDGEQLAYVSFENGNSEVFVQHLRTGQRKSVSSQAGLNSAPAWSPDGRRLALTLSGSGSAEVFVLDLASERLTRVTHSSNSIDTEPVWMPNGREIVFTSDRGGRPQIYKVSAEGGQPERLTFQGNYNASADVSPDGRLLTMVHGTEGRYFIAVQDLQTGAMQTLTQTGRDESPSFAPNSRMILYATEQNGRGVLAAVSVDGRIQQRLSETGTQVREPAWSPIIQ